MKKNILFIYSTIFCLLYANSSFAQGDLKDPILKSEAEFQTLKKITLESIEQRRILVEKEKNCVTASQNRKELKDCLKDTQKDRKEMIDNFKTTIKETKQKNSTAEKQ